MGGIDFRPGVDYGDDFGRRQIGEGFVVGGRKGKNVAFADDGFGAEEERFCSCRDVSVEFAMRERKKGYPCPRAGSQPAPP